MVDVLEGTSTTSFPVASIFSIKPEARTSRRSEEEIKRFGDLR